MEASTKKNRNIWGSRPPGAGGRGVGHAVWSDTMKFGWMTLSLSPSAADDLAAVHQQLEQGVLAEAIGFDYLWLTEH
ncbi:MAG: LLM class flavin-dependent oxidoreductase, partial [Methanobacteriota archaeon]